MVSRPLDSVLQWGCELSSKDDLTLRERGVMAGEPSCANRNGGVHSEGAGGSYCPENRLVRGHGQGDRSWHLRMDTGGQGHILGD